MRKKAVWALGHYKPEISGVIDCLIQGLKDDDRGRRKGELTVPLLAAQALGNYKEKAVSAVPALIKAVDGSYFELKLYAIQALGHIGPSATKAVPVLTRCVQEKGTRTVDHRQLQRCAIWSLGQIGKPAKPALPALEKALANESEEVRLEAKAAIERINK